MERPDNFNTFMSETKSTEKRSPKELKPCPFCGKTPKIVNKDVEPQGDPWYGSKCEDFILCECGCCLFDGAFHEGFWKIDERGIQAWNNRVQTDFAQLTAENQALKEEVTELKRVKALLSPTAWDEARTLLVERNQFQSDLKEMTRLRDEAVKERDSLRGQFEKSWRYTCTNHNDAARASAEIFCPVCALASNNDLRAQLAKAQGAVEKICENAIRNAEQSESMEVRGFALAIVCELRAIIEKENGR